MRKFHLLRNQQESGPFTLEELKALDPGVSDMIWVEGQSRSWRPASQISELEIEHSSGSSPLPDLDADQRHHAAPKSQARRTNRINRMAWIITGLFLVILGVMVALYFSTSRKESLPSTRGIVLNPDTPEVPKDTIKKKPPKPVHIDIADDIDASANDYKVGFFGGIKDLKVNVTNRNANTADKIIIRTDFLKPNDEVIQTEESTVTALKSGASQEVAIPESQRGVKVRIRVIKASATIYVPDEG